MRLVYSLFSIRWPLAKVFPGLQTIRKDFLRPVCTLLGIFLGLLGFLFVLVFIPVAQVSPHDNFRQLLEASSAPPTPLRYNLRNLALQLHAPVNSDFLFISLLEPSEFIAIKILTLSAKHRLQNFLPAVFILEVTDCSCTIEDFMLRLTHAYISPLFLNKPLTLSCSSTRFHRKRVNYDIKSTLL